MDLIGVFVMLFEVLMMTGGLIFWFLVLMFAIERIDKRIKYRRETRDIRRWR